MVECQMTKRGFILSDEDEYQMLFSFTDYCGSIYVAATLVQTDIGISTVTRDRQIDPIENDTNEELWHRVRYQVRSLVFNTMIGDWEPSAGHVEHVVNNMNQVRDQIVEWMLAADQAYLQHRQAMELE